MAHRRQMTVVDGPSTPTASDASAALNAISRWGLPLDGVHRVELYVEPWNEGSWRAAERACYVREGLLRSWQRVRDERRDMYMYSLLPQDLPADPS